MTVRIETVVQTERSTVTSFIGSGYELPEPRAAVSSISVPGLPALDRRLTAARRAFIASAIAVGTMTAGPTPPQNPVGPVNLTIESVVVTVPEPSVSAAEEYARLREQIVAADIPLLNDEELREEIRERKGLKPEREA